MEPFDNKLILPHDLMESLSLVIKNQNAQLYKKMDSIIKKNNVTL